MTGDDPDELCPGYNAWERYWMSLSPEARAQEIRLMDEYVAFIEQGHERKGEGTA